MNVRVVILLIVMLGIGFALGKFPNRIIGGGGDAPVNWSSGPTVEQLERLSHLVSLKIFVADILTATGPNYRGSWLVKGDALLGIDLGTASVPERDDGHRVATVLLPLPSVISARVDHNKTKTWDVEKTTWKPWAEGESKLRDEAMRQAQALVEHAAASEETINRAKTNAEGVIRNLYEMVGWTVRIKWKEQLEDTQESRPAESDQSPK